MQNKCKSFDLHGHSVVTSILLYYTIMPLWTYSYPTKASIFIKGCAILLKALGGGHPCPVDI